MCVIFAGDNLGYVKVAVHAYTYLLAKSADEFCSYSPGFFSRELVSGADSVVGLSADESAGQQLGQVVNDEGGSRCPANSPSQHEPGRRLLQAGIEITFAGGMNAVRFAPTSCKFQLIRI
jgi:hypothetical protein